MMDDDDVAVVEDDDCCMTTASDGVDDHAPIGFLYDAYRIHIMMPIGILQEAYRDVVDDVAGVVDDDVDGS